MLRLLGATFTLIWVVDAVINCVKCLYYVVNENLVYSCRNVYLITVANIKVQMQSNMYSNFLK